MSGPRAESVHKGRSRLALVWGALLVPIGYFIPLPGVDDALANQLLGRGELLSFLPVIGALGATIPSYATVRFLARPYEGLRAQQMACAAYLLLAFLQAFGIGYWLEDMSTGFGSIVPAPGWLFRLGVACAWTAGAAIVWASGAWIDRTGTAHGPLYLLLGYTMTHAVIDGFGLGASFAAGSVPASAVMAWWVMPLGLVSLSVVLLLRPLGGWPLTLRRWPLRSSWDVLAIATVAVVPTSMATMFANAVAEPLPAWLEWSEALISLAIVARMMSWAWRLGVGWQGRAEGTTAQRAPSVVALVSVLAVAGSFGLAFGLGGGWERATSPAPLAGQAAFSLELAADDSFAPSDADGIAHRLGALGVELEVVSAAADRIALRVDAALSERDVIDALSPNALTIHEALDLLAEGHGSVLQLPGFPLPSRAGSVGLAAACLPLFSWLRHTSDDARCLYRVEETEAGCVLHCVSPDPIVTSEDVVDAAVLYGDGVSVQARLSPDARARFAAASERLIGRRIVIMVDDFVLSAPEVASPIPGGVLSLWMSRESDSGAARREAEVFAESLRPASRMIGSWHLAE